MIASADSNVFCALNNQPEQIGGRLRGWDPDYTIRWSVSASPGGFSIGDLEGVIADCFADVNQVVQVKNEKVSRGENVQIMTRGIDGAFGVLAEAELAGVNSDGNDFRRLWFDSGERFSLSPQVPPGRVDLYAVALHELLHILGISHAPQGSNNLMAPAIRSINARDFGPWDIDELLKRYNKPGSGGGDMNDSGRAGGCDLAKLVDVALEIGREYYPEQFRAGARCNNLSTFLEIAELVRKVGCDDSVNVLRRRLEAAERANG